MSIKRMPIQYRFIVFVLAGLLMLLACNMPDNSPPPAPADDGSEATRVSLLETQQALTSEQAGESQPPANDPPPAAPSSGGTTDSTASLEGASLAFSGELVGRVQPELIAANPTSGPGSAAHPRYVQFNMPDVSGFVSMVPIHYYELVDSATVDVFNELIRVLEYEDAHVQSCIAELSLNTFYRSCGHQEFNANIAYPQFQNGGGVRFVTVYGIQDVVPVSNEHLVYVFLGSTYDMECYLSAVFTISHSGLDDTGSIPQEVYIDNSGELWRDYVDGFEGYLNQNPGYYSPELARIDAVINSLQVMQCGVNQ